VNIRSRLALRSLRHHAQQHCHWNIDEQFSIVNCHRYKKLSISYLQSASQPTSFCLTVLHSPFSSVLYRRLGFFDSFLRTIRTSSSNSQSTSTTSTTHRNHAVHPRRPCFSCIPRLRGSVASECWSPRSQRRMLRTQCQLEARRLQRQWLHRSLRSFWRQRL
jgi:hypothetical protein